jgi:hypothetical protein
MMDNQQTEPHVQEQVLQPPKKKWTKKRKIMAIVLAIIILLAVTIGVLIYVYKDRLVVMTKEPYQEAVLDVSVCGTNIVKKYNDIYRTPIAEVADATSQNSLFSDLSEEIRSKSYYEQDPTCQTILFWGSFFNRDTANMQKAYDGLRNLYNDGLYANSDMENSASLSGMEQVIDEASLLIELGE